MPETTTPIETPPAPELLRQQPLNLSIPKGVALVGCGGVGSWIAYFLALAGVRNLWLFDHDTVSEHNLNRLLLPPSAIGRSKSQALAEMIALIRPNDDTIPLSEFTPDLANLIKLHKEIDWIIPSTDTHASRLLVHQWAKDHKLCYLEAAAEGEIGSIADAPAEWVTDAEASPGYASVPVWVGPCVSAAMMTCAHILHATQPRPNQALRLGWRNRIEFYDSTATSAPKIGRFSVQCRNIRTGIWSESMNDGLRGVTFSTTAAAYDAITTYGSQARTSNYRVIDHETKLPIDQAA
jgi:hypothetical protein